MQKLISENEAQEMCLKLLRNRMNNGKKDRPKSGKWAVDINSIEQNTFRSTIQ